MTSRDFCFWFQGYLEVSGATSLNEAQMECVRKHLALAFVHDIDASMGGPKHQEALNKIHNNPGPVMRC